MTKFEKELCLIRNGFKFSGFCHPVKLNPTVRLLNSQGKEVCTLKTQDGLALYTRNKQ